MEYDASLLREFAIEAREHLESVEDTLLRLAIQKDDPDREMIDRVFRSVHSIKGGAGFLSLQQMSKLAHAMEALLSEFRTGNRPIGHDTIDALIAGVDLIQLMLEDTDRSNDVNIAQVHKRLSDLLICKEPENPAETALPDPASRVPALNPDEFRIDPETLREIPTSHEFLYLLRYDLHALWKTETRSPVQLIKELTSLGKIADARISSQKGQGLADTPLICTFLYSTILDPGIIAFASGLPEDQILKVDKESVQSAACSVQNEPPEIVINLDEPSPAPEHSAQFLSESEEVLEQVEQCIFDLPEKPDKIQEAFRMIHSFKGNAGLMGFSDFEHLSHQIETILDNIRSGNLSQSDSVKQRLLQGVDALRDGLTGLSKNGIARISECDRIIEALRLSDNPTEAGVTENTECFQNEASRKLSESEAYAKRSAPKHDIRVDLEKLDVLINLVGELVIAESMVSRHHLSNSGGSESAIHNLRRIINELQDVALSMRMIPLSRTFRKMFRLVHDLSLKSGKQIGLSLVGEDTEVDKTVIEHITDPLVHIIRNCADHGIEPPEERRKKGKPETGQIIIRAGHEAGEVVIQVTDDGQGLNREKILAKAASMGMISNDRSQMSDDAIYRLIFEPGFSTASEVTDVSGRGVGMDVVRRNLEKLKGRIDIHTAPDKGTTLTFRLPLTLAIIEGMLIRVGDSRYTVPLLSIRESFRPKPEQITRTPDMDEIIRIRDDFLPVLRLHKQYGIVPDQTELHKGILIRVASGAKSLCLFADEIIGHHHTVIRGIPEYLAASVKGISGFTILDNGQVSIILDVGGMIDAYERQENNEG